MNFERYIRVYKRWLTLYPRPFREKYEHELIQVLQDQLEEAHYFKQTPQTLFMTELTHLAYQAILLRYQHYTGVHGQRLAKLLRHTLSIVIFFIVSSLTDTFLSEKALDAPRYAYSLPVLILYAEAIRVSKNYKLASACFLVALYISNRLYLVGLSQFFVLYSVIIALRYFRRFYPQQRIQVYGKQKIALVLASCLLCAHIVANTSLKNGQPTNELIFDSEVFMPILDKRSVKTQQNLWYRLSPYLTISGGTFDSQTGYTYKPLSAIEEGCHKIYLEGPFECIRTTLNSEEKAAMLSLQNEMYFFEPASTDVVTLKNLVTYPEKSNVNLLNETYSTSKLEGLTFESINSAFENNDIEEATNLSKSLVYLSVAKLNSYYDVQGALYTSDSVISLWNILDRSKNYPEKYDEIIRALPSQEFLEDAIEKGMRLKTLNNASAIRSTWQAMREHADKPFSFSNRPTREFQLFYEGWKTVNAIHQSNCGENPSVYLDVFVKHSEFEIHPDAHYRKMANDIERTAKETAAKVHETSCRISSVKGQYFKRMAGPNLP